MKEKMKKLLIIIEKYWEKLVFELFSIWMWLWLIGITINYYLWFIIGKFLIWFGKKQRNFWIYLFFKKKKIAFIISRIKYSKWNPFYKKPTREEIRERWIEIEKNAEQNPAYIELKRKSQSKEAIDKMILEAIEKEDKKTEFYPPPNPVNPEKLMKIRTKKYLKYDNHTHFVTGKDYLIKSIIDNIEAELIEGEIRQREKDKLSQESKREELLLQKEKNYSNWKIQNLFLKKKGFSKEDTYLKQLEKEIKIKQKNTVKVIIPSLIRKMPKYSYFNHLKNQNKKKKIKPLSFSHRGQITDKKGKIPLFKR